MPRSETKSQVYTLKTAPPSFDTVTKLTIRSAENSKELKGLLERFTVPIMQMQSDIEVLRDGLLGLFISAFSL